ncbi:hypothetical protein KFK09_010064 [Dendrobium nobile]|uniref:Uncharacterized protein n=1 Tax=Dendrobium nobile TaxID=94219 RepID=A0A8T3BL93_DENNO|nr:hypothetical protein KFK09_010064 [Dendrobium nobile]
MLKEMAVEDEEDDYHPPQLPLQWRDPPPHYPHEEQRKRRRAVDDHRCCEALRAAQVIASLDRMDALFINFDHSIEQICTHVIKLSSDIYLHSYSNHYSYCNPESLHSF